MKTITIKGEEFSYRVFYDCDEHNGIYSRTEFYQGTQISPRKKYFLFGPIVNKTIPKLVFMVGFDIESPEFTKEEIKSKLERKVSILHRAEEISRGEII